MVTAPGGSAVTTASLSGVTSATPSFVPDVEGDYAMRVVVARGAATASTTVTIHAFGAPVIYTADEGDGAAGSPWKLRIDVVGAAGGDASALDCAQWDAGPFGTGPHARRIAGAASDLWEAPPGTPSRIAYVFANREPDAATGYTYLATGTTSATCAAPPTIRERIDEGVGSYLLQPQFSPDGSRIAFVKNSGYSARIATISSSGADAARILAPHNADDDGGLIADDGGLGAVIGMGIRPRWADATHVGWVQQRGTAGSDWQVSIADDSATPTVTRFMTCIGVTHVPFELDFLGDGSVLVSAIVDRDGGSSVQELLVMRPGPDTSCTIVRNLSALDADWSFARDFSLSPDKKSVAFLRQDALEDTGVPGSSVFVGPVSGATAPTRVVGAPRGGGVTGPRWIAGGTALAWGQAGATVGANDAGTAVVVLPVDGGTVRVVAAGTASEHVTAMGNAFFNCAIGVGGGGSMVTGLAAVAAFVTLLARRRRKSE